MAAKHAEDSSGEKFTLFFGIESPFSQFHPAKFTINGITYSCAEQYMMHQKAVEFKDSESAELILEAKEPRKMKAQGKKVANFDPVVWSKRSVEVVREGNIAKFSQNPHLLEKLFATKGTTLVEASPRDCLWGIGLGAKNPKAQDRRNWRGKNLLGNILTEVCCELLEKKGAAVIPEKEEESVVVKRLSASEAKTTEPAEKIQKMDTFFYFEGKDSPFSLFHPSEFTVDGVKYSCGEQYMMHQKALEFQDKATAKKIMCETEPIKMKKIGDKISRADKDRWISKCKDVVHKGNLAKFEQNKQLRKELFRTHGAQIANASQDPILGIGFGASNKKAKQRSTWTGMNILGDALTQVRDILMEGHLDEADELKTD